MTVSMRVMSAGDGYRYLLKTVTVADGVRSLSTPLTRYYLEEGTPPGRWLGAGVAALGAGELRVGDRVSEAQLQLLMGAGCDPITGDPLGRAFPVYKSQTGRIDARIAAVDPALSPGAKGEVVAQIVAEETARGTRRAVAGFDFTFSIPKSASVLWAVADAGVQALIGDAHHRAVAEVVAFMEREVAATRTGATGGDGAVAQVDVTGLVATAFDHFDSRAGDPHLHTHAVISNKAETVLDGKWRSLDGRPMHATVVALSELHEAVFADHMTRTFGIEWEAREMGRDRNPAWGDLGRAGGSGDRVLDPRPAHRRRNRSAHCGLCRGAWAAAVPGGGCEIAGAGDVDDPARQAGPVPGRSHCRLVDPDHHDPGPGRDPVGTGGHQQRAAATVTRRRCTARCDRRDRPTRGGDRRGEVFDLAALEPHSGGVPTGDGLVIRHHARSRSHRRDDRRCRPTRINPIDPTRPGQFPVGVPSGRRLDGVPAERLDCVLLRGPVGGRGPAPATRQ